MRASAGVSSGARLTAHAAVAVPAPAPVAAEEDGAAEATAPPTVAAEGVEQSVFGVAGAAAVEPGIVAVTARSFGYVAVAAVAAGVGGTVAQQGHERTADVFVEDDTGALARVGTAAASQAGY